MRLHQTHQGPRNTDIVRMTILVVLASKEADCRSEGVGTLLRFCELTEVMTTPVTGKSRGVSSPCDHIRRLLRRGPILYQRTSRTHPAAQVASSCLGQELTREAGSGRRSGPRAASLITPEPHVAVRPPRRTVPAAGQVGAHARVPWPLRVEVAALLGDSAWRPLEPAAYSSSTGGGLKPDIGGRYPAKRFW